jgi:NADPH2:quinone reductase
VSDPELVVGAHVIAICPSFGAFATEVEVPASFVFCIPTSFGPRNSQQTLARAAAVPVVCGTAWLAWRLCGLSEDGDAQAQSAGRDEHWVLVTGGSGGAGAAAVMIAKALGYRVIATARGAEKTRFCGDVLHADRVIDVSRSSAVSQLAQTVRELTCPCDRTGAVGSGVDAAFDAVGGDFLSQCIRATRWGGRVAVVGFASGKIPKISANVLLVKGVTLVGVYFGRDMMENATAARELFKAMLEFVGRKGISLPISACFTLDDAKGALETLMNGQAIGKVLIACDPDYRRGDLGYGIEGKIGEQARARL